MYDSVAAIRKAIIRRDRMSGIRLGTTGIEIKKNGFGALPIQRVPLENAAALL